MVPYTLVMDSSCGSLLEWDSGAGNGGADNGGADNGALVPLRLSMQGDTSRIPFSCLVQSAVHFYQEKKGVNPTQLVVITPPEKDVSVQSEGGIVLTCSVLVKVECNMCVVASQDQHASNGINVANECVPYHV